MSGKPGQQSTKAVTVPKKFRPGFLKVMDRRTKVARLLRDRMAQLVADQGGLERMTYLRRSLCERAIHLEGLLFAIEQKMLAGQQIDEGTYRGHINSLIGIARTLGIDRVAAKMPSAIEYAERYNGAARK